MKSDGDGNEMTHKTDILGKGKYFILKIQRSGSELFDTNFDDYAKLNHNYELDTIFLEVYF